MSVSACRSILFIVHVAALAVFAGRDDTKNPPPAPINPPPPHVPVARALAAASSAAASADVDASSSALASSIDRTYPPVMP